MKTETITLHQERNVTLTAYLQAVGGEFGHVVRRPAILVLPGGGYRFCSDREADPIAFPYLQAGFQAFVLRYSVMENAAWPNPLEDYEQAMQIILDRADAWGICADKIAVIGFSAGGHLAACAATMARRRPNAAILGYAVTRGDDVKTCHPSLPDVIGAVDGNTCPCFVFATRTDNVVPIENSIEFLAALTKADVSYESHIYAYGPHGFSLGSSAVQSRNAALCDRAPRWVADSISWLRDVLGDFGPDGMTPPVCGAHFSGDHDPFLSTDCTIGHLLQDPQAVQLLAPLFAQSGVQGAVREATVRRMRLRDALQYVRLPAADIEALDSRLRQIPNE